MLTGFGEPLLLTRGVNASAIAQDLVFSPQLVGFELVPTVEDSRKIKAWKNCQKVIVASAKGEIEWQLTLRYEIDWAALQVGFGEIAQNVNVTLPTRKEARVPAVTPFTISDAAVTAGSDVRCYLADKIGNEQPGHLVSSAVAPTGRQFQISAGVLTFPSTLAGAPIVYTVPTVLTSVASIGKAASAVAIEEYQFMGHACGDGFVNGVRIHCPKIKQAGLPTINTDEDEPVIEIPYDVLTLAGERTPVHMYINP